MPQITFHEISLLWMAEKSRYVKMTTMAAYSLIIQNHLEPCFGLLEDVKQHTVQKYIDTKLAQGTSATTIKGHIIVLKMILRYGEKQGLAGQRIIDARFPTQRMKAPMAILSINEEKKMLEYLSSHHDSYNLGLQICLFTGLRIGEVCALKWDDVDISLGIIRIRRTVHRVYLVSNGSKRSELTVDYPKTASSYRDIPIIKELSDILYEYSRGKDSDSFIISGHKRPTEPQTMRNHFKHVANSLNLSMRRFHGLRHTFGTRCVESKCDYKTLSTILGHSNVSTTLNLYVHPGMEQKRKCVEEMLKAIM